MQGAARNKNTLAHQLWARPATQASAGVQEILGEEKSHWIPPPDAGRPGPDTSPQLFRGDDFGEKAGNHRLLRAPLHSTQDQLLGLERSDQARK